jgi:hypothetical protein
VKDWEKEHEVCLSQHQSGEWLQKR